MRTIDRVIFAAVPDLLAGKKARVLRADRASPEKDVDMVGLSGRTPPGTLLDRAASAAARNALMSSVG